MTDKVTFDELITELCQITQYKNLNENEPIIPFWQNILNKFHYYIYPEYSIDLNNIFNIINSDKPFIILNEIEQKNIIQKQYIKNIDEFVKKYNCNVIIIKNNKATYLKYIKKKLYVIIYQTHDNLYCPVHKLSKFIFDKNEITDLLMITDLGKININKLKKKELCDIANIYKINFNTNDKKAIIYEKILNNY